MAFKKGQTKIGGKVKGSQNKLTATAKEMFIGIMEGEINNIKQSLDLTRKESPAKYLDVLSKLMPYFMPKQIDVKSGGDKIKQVFMIGGVEITL